MPCTLPKLQTVGGGQAGQAVGPLDELVVEAGAQGLARPAPGR